MRVKRLKMEAFRGIGDLTLDFDETEPTVLIGINGVGKSSILDCLAILLSHLIKEMINKNSKGKFFSGRIFNAEDIKNQYQKTHNEITISFLSDELTWSLTTIREQGNIKIKYNVNNQELRNAFPNYDDEYDDDEDDYDEDNYDEDGEQKNHPLAVLYPVNRAVINIDLEIEELYSFDKIDAYHQSLNGVIIYFDTFFKWFRVLEDLENENMRDNSKYKNPHLEAVRQSIYSLIPGFSNLRVRRFPLRMTVQKQGEELIINQLSDGEKCLLAMVGDLARRLAIANPGLSDPLQGSGVVLIDEIELHLHPKWQREIIPALTRTFPNCQFIVTTHSPQVVSHVKPEGIYILEKTDTGVIAKRPESSFGRDSNRILEDLMDVPARPQEIKDSLLELFRLIDAGDLTSARELRQQLAAEIGADEPDFVKADVLIRRKEIIGR